MSNKTTIFIALFLTAALALGARNTYPHKNTAFPASSGPAVFMNAGYVNNTGTIDTADTEKIAQKDTLWYNRPPGLAAASFSAVWGDSVKIVNVIMARFIGGQQVPVVAGDTIIAAFTATGDSNRVATLTLTPLCDAYRFIVSYDSVGQGRTDSTVKYQVNQQFYTR